MANFEANPTTTKLSGAWLKESKFGKFYSSAPVAKTLVLEALEKIDGDVINLMVSVNGSKLNEETSPDVTIKIVAPRPKEI